jgi:cysteine synthase A
MRLTENFKAAIIDQALRINDNQMINMLYFLARHEGLIVGTSAALNVSAVYQLAVKPENKGKTFVTMLCDSGLRYQSRIFNDQYLKEKNLIPSEVL